MVPPMLPHLRTPLLLLSLLLACTPPSETPHDAGVSPDAGLPTDAGAPDAWYPPVVPAGVEATDALCSNGLDDDNNGFADCQDYWCTDSPRVTVCHALENTDAQCSDGVDNAETPLGASRPRTDALVDCDDPDCNRNPDVTVCAHPRHETGPACANQTDDDGDGAVDCDDLDCLAASSSSCALGGRIRVLFDNAHRQQAGSADWVVDATQPLPWPSQPADAAHWKGALAAWGAALVQGGAYTVETLPPNGHLSHGDLNNRQDLSLFGVLVLDEPSAPFTPDEHVALQDFLDGGGGILLLADHDGADRDGNGWDAVRAFNDWLTTLGGGTLANNPLGFSVRVVSYDAAGTVDGLNGARATTRGITGTHPVLDGAHGTVDAVGTYRAGQFDLYPQVNPDVTALLHALPANTGGFVDSPYVVATRLGRGRVVAVGDSTVAISGTDSHGYTQSAAPWTQPNADNAALLLNAVDWLAEPR